MRRPLNLRLSLVSHSSLPWSHPTTHSQADDAPLKPSAMDIDAPAKGAEGLTTATTTIVSADAATRPRSAAVAPPPLPRFPKEEERAVRPPPKKAKKEAAAAAPAAAAEKAAAAEGDSEEEEGDAPVAVGKRPRRAAAAAARRRAVVSEDDDEDDQDDSDDADSGSESDFSEAAASQEETEDVSWRERDEGGRERAKRRKVVVATFPSSSANTVSSSFAFHQKTNSRQDDDDDDDDDDEGSDEDDDEEEDESEEEPSPPKKKGRSAAAAKAAPPPRPSAAKSTPFAAKTSYSAATPFAQTPATPATAGGGGESNENENSDAVARYSARDAERFPFLQPGSVRDASGLQPGDLNHDRRTLRIPPGWFKAMKITEAQRQWWELKARNFDSVLLFKMGKFYEMFEMDAHVGADVLGLQYMKGEQPHCGFPEASYAPYAEKLARAGLRVVVVEQTETPAALAERNEERKRKGLQKVNVVNRDVVSVLTIGTLTDPEMLSSSPDAANVLVLVEFSPPKNDENAAAAGNNINDADDNDDDATATTILGACCFDAATGRVSVGGWADSASRPRLRALLAELRPVEVVVPRGSGGSASCPPSSRVSPVPATTLAPVTRRAILCGGGLSLRVNELDAPSDAGAALDAVDASYSAASSSVSSRPPLVERLASSLRDGSDSPSAAAPAAAALSALAAASAFLRDCRLDAAVLGLRRLERLPCADVPSARDAEEISLLSGQDGAGSSSSASLSPFHESLPPLAIDGAALDALEVLANGAGGVAGTLLSALDFCVSPPGRRRLRAWLCRPLGCPRAISKRQDAVETLLTSARSAADSARASLARCGDLERSLARLSAAAAAAAASAAGGGVGRDAAGVVLYEDAAKRRVLALVGALSGLRSALDALAEMRSLPGSHADANSVLGALSGSPLLSSADAALRELESAADWRAAAQAGRVSPSGRGADAAVDAAADALAAADAALAAHLDDERSALKCRSAALVSLGKETHVLEVPDATKVPADYSLVAQRKGFRRYVSSRLRELVAERDEACAQREVALAGVLRGLLARFGARSSAWTAVADAAATLDALLSLAAAAEAGGAFGPMCRPAVLPPVRRRPDAEGEEGGEAAADKSSSAAPSLRAVALRHPAAEALLLSSSATHGGDSSFSSSSTFVPNDVSLGSVDSKAAVPPFVLLTGPNMGGKSTLLRQVCLAALAAHAGAWVPASSFELTAVDAVFVRAGGARDAMLAGASTFLVELQEAAAPLQRGTVNSLVALDELGRGTATADGAAIAGAVLDSLALKTGCRGLFATHYHSLSAEKEKKEGDGVSSSSSSGLAVARGGALPMHMSCRVDDDDDSPNSVPCVTFLYKLVRGACPKSYGTNVARLAGLPEPVVARAAALAAELEEEGKGGGEGGEDASPSTPFPADLADLVRRAAAAATGKGGDLREAVQAARTAVEAMV